MFALPTFTSVPAALPSVDVMIAHASTPLLEAIVIAVMVLVSGVIVQLVVDARMTSTSVRLVARPRIERAA